MSVFFDDAARELFEIWAALDAVARVRLLDLAKRLIEHATSNESEGVQ